MDDVTFPRVTALVLAGGQSRRMGRNKAFLDFAGAPLIERVIERVQSLCVETIIVANDAERYARFGLRIVRDVYQGKGSLGGIFSGLQAASEEYALAVACDLPFLNDALLRYLTTLAPQADVVIPRSHAPTGKAKVATRYEHLAVKDSGLQATQAIYSRRCLEPMRARLLADDLCIINFFDEVRVRVVEPHEVVRFDPLLLSFVNVNRPCDLAMALSLVNRK
ncbi:MAG TPA: molybdenum cofactor guanylyltransferase [Geobacteraceae bacterium]|nr:molybdenum cofactor guanylyltransferase [Geobacteraceae bacterium]